MMIIMTSFILHFNELNISTAFAYVHHYKVLRFNFTKCHLAQKKNKKKRSWSFFRVIFTNYHLAKTIT